MTHLLLTDVERAQLRDLRERAAAAPVNMIGLAERLKKPAAKCAHMRQMGDQTLDLPINYHVTFSIETGHPGGIARHLSVSIDNPDRMPLPEAIWIIAGALGFVGQFTLDDWAGCHLWLEDLQGHSSKAVNLVQLITTEGTEEHHA